MNNLEIIRTACIASNPSILDLKFGCRMKNGYAGDINPHKIGTYIKTGYRKDRVNSGKFYSMTDCNGDFWEMSPRYNDKLEIIGREIRLSDVLLALKEKWNKLAEESRKMRVVCLDFKVYFWDLVDKWDLKYDNLNDQSEETLQFLADLLGGVK